MVELLGVLLALIIFGLGMLVWRVLRWLRRGLRLLFGRAAPGHRMAALRGVRLRASRALSRHQADRLAALTTELDRARRDLRQARAGGQDGDRFRRAKQAFAFHFHPDKLACAEPERGIRTSIFQQFWGVLRRIERS
ncbi:hypothetical protein [Paracraurococcus ruber]|uniref:J domain-containing protein n=1 Tax=Paracraurococcus ruber TaxID=77675 RepID=A0ABS1D2I0_9PROT|nr:hypothetical protein [Paracraurococcus ruber]MBK1661046.1 hypothetical protein [Paracraurococcus ruber]TDG29661.1 hypothetical protein E2C05_17275 [Paracraurococcus ruber]